MSLDWIYCSQTFVIMFVMIIMYLLCFFHDLFIVLYFLCFSAS